VVDELDYFVSAVAIQDRIKLLSEIQGVSGLNADFFYK
jgi:hypothetical protein